MMDSVESMLTKMICMRIKGKNHKNVMKTLVIMKGTFIPCFIFWCVKMLGKFIKIL